MSLRSSDSSTNYPSTTKKEATKSETTDNYDNRTLPPFIEVDNEYDEEEERLEAEDINEELRKINDKERKGIAWVRREAEKKQKATKKKRKETLMEENARCFSQQYHPSLSIDVQHCPCEPMHMRMCICRIFEVIMARMLYDPDNVVGGEDEKEEKEEKKVKPKRKSKSELIKQLRNDRSFRELNRLLKIDRPLTGYHSH